MPNRRFLALEWPEAGYPWQDTLISLDDGICSFPSLCPNSPHLYLIFAMIPKTLFWARSITGHLQDCFLGDFRLVDFHQGSVTFREREGTEVVWGQYFSSLRKKKTKGLVEIVPCLEDNVSRYIFRESQGPGLSLRFA